MATYTPLQEKKRIISIDIVRGIALFGILLVNMALFKTPVYHESILPGAVSPPDSLLDQVAALFIDAFATGKFYPLFSLLFGLGFYMMMERFSQRSTNPKRFLVRRTVLLLVIGLIHLIFFWSGDVLHTYALAAFLLLLFWGKSVRLWFGWAIGLLVATALIAFVLLVSNTVMLESSLGEQMIGQVEQTIDDAYHVYATGSYTDILLFRLINEVPSIVFNVVFAVPNVLAAFLVGMIAGRMRWFSQPRQNRRLLLTLCGFGWLVGGSLTIVFVSFNAGWIDLGSVWNMPMSQALNIVAGPLLMLGYVATFILLFQAETWKRLLQPFANVGRLALTNYLLQSVIGLLIFNGYGFGLFGEISIASGLLLTIVIYVGQVVASTMWLRLFQMGPLEWLWRAWTYRYFPAIRRRSDADASA